MIDPITLSILLGYGAKAVTGAFQANRARKGLKALRNQPMPQFGITPEQTTSYNRAERLANTGFTGSERAAIGQNIAGASNLAYRRAMDIGGGSGARSIQGALNASGLNAYNRMGADDAALRRRNMQYADTVGRGITNQRNMETQRALNYRMELERSLGAAKTQGIENIANAFGGVGAVAAYGGLDGLKGMKIPNFGRGGASPSGSNFAQLGMGQQGYSPTVLPPYGFEEDSSFNLSPSYMKRRPF